MNFKLRCKNKKKSIREKREGKCQAEKIACVKALRQKPTWVFQITERPECLNHVSKRKSGTDNIGKADKVKSCKML